MDWFDREMERLEEELDKGEISEEDFYAQIRDLREELREEAQQAAEDTYRDRMGEW